jgi:signal transduction histidine kinase
MQEPLTPVDEQARLAALDSYDVLDTADEAAFTNLAELAAALLGTPIALISLADAERQWFKARVGLDAASTPRAISFCGHVVYERATMLVPDAHTDDRFADNPLVTGAPHVRFYAGAPLATQSGHVLGTLCAIDNEPRAITEGQKRQLELLAAQVVSQLELRKSRRDLVAQLAANEALRMRKQIILDSVNDGFVLHDGGIVTLKNQAAVDMIDGASLTDEAGVPVDEAALLASTERLLRSDAGGRIRWLIAQTREATPGAFVTVLKDITLEREHEKSRERASQHQRLVTTGTLAAGVGHEINNPLAYVLANIELALEELRSMAGASPSGQMKNLIEALSDAKEGAELIRRIVRGLRALAREDTHPTACNLEEAVETALHMAMHELRQKASVHVDLKDAPPVLADEARLSQLFVNLLVNAGQAFEHAAPERNAVRITATPRTDTVVLRVADNGPGIAPENLARIFDPFFTTKPVGVGTGLGLAICHGIVTGLGGSISCVSTPGQGACFEIELPRAPTHTQQVMFEAPPKTPVGRVLVVDDDAGVMRTVQRTLAAKHHVTAYGDPREALAAIERGDRFDVVFCDVMMPHMRGTELYRRVFRVDPHLASRFVFITGGADDDSVDQVAAQGGISTLEKPFTTEALRATAERFIKSG